MVADTVVVTPNHISFYLQSHDSPLGTAKNGHYVVIHDDRKFDANSLQDIVSRLSPFQLRPNATFANIHTRRTTSATLEREPRKHSPSACQLGMRTSSGTASDVK
jgi:hypothetical protein